MRFNLLGKTEFTEFVASCSKWLFYTVKFATAAGEKSKPDWSYIFSKEYRGKIEEGIRNVTLTSDM